MRLGAVYSGRSGPILATARLSESAEALTLLVDGNHGDLVSETVERRLAQLAGLMKRNPQLVVD